MCVALMENDYSSEEGVRNPGCQDDGTAVSHKHLEIVSPAFCPMRAACWSAFHQSALWAVPITQPDDGLSAGL